MQQIEVFDTFTIDGRRYAIVDADQLEAVLTRSAAGAAAHDDGEPALAAYALPDRQLATRIRMERERLGLTQSELARRAEVRVETVNRIERAKTTPDFATLRRIAVALRQAAASPR